MPTSTKIFISILVVIGMQAAAIALTLETGSQAALPSDDDYVVAILSVNKPLSDQDNAINLTRHDAEKSPFDHINALIKNGKTDADQRYFGYAEAELDALSLDNKKNNYFSAEWAQLKIYLLQQRHAFNDAHNLLQFEIQKNPNNKAQYFNDASLLVMLGHYSAAEKSCLNALGAIDLVTYSACLTQASVKKTDLEKRALALQMLLNPQNQTSYLWERAILADAQTRLGKMADAEQNYLIVLQQNNLDHVSRIALADVYIQQNRWRDVYALLEPFAQQDSALLRLALASKNVGLDDAKWNEQIALRFSATNPAASSDQLFYLLHWQPNSTQIKHIAQTLFESSKAAPDIVLTSQATTSDSKSDSKSKSIFDWIHQQEYYDARITL